MKILICGLLLVFSFVVRSQNTVKVDTNSTTKNTFYELGLDVSNLITRYGPNLTFNIGKPIRERFSVNYGFDIGVEKAPTRFGQTIDYKSLRSNIPFTVRTKIFNNFFTITGVFVRLNFFRFDREENNYLGYVQNGYASHPNTSEILCGAGFQIGCLYQPNRLGISVNFRMTSSEKHIATLSAGVCYQLNI